LTALQGGTVDRGTQMDPSTNYLPYTSNTYY